MQNRDEIKIKQPSYKELFSNIDENALLALKSAKNMIEWTRGLDQYRYWTVRREQVTTNKRLYK